MTRVCVCLSQTLLTFDHHHFAPQSHPQHYSGISPGICSVNVCRLPQWNRVLVSHSHRVILFIPIFSSFRTLFVFLFLCRFSSKSSVIELSKDHHRRALSNKLPYAQTICPLYILTIYYRSSFHLPPTLTLTRLFWNGIVSCEFLIHVLCNHTHTKGHHTVPMHIWMSCLWVSCDLLVYIWGNGHSLTLSLP